MPGNPSRCRPGAVSRKWLTPHDLASKSRPARHVLYLPVSALLKRPSRPRVNGERREKPMSTMTKFLALMPLVVLGAACNGVSPVAPDNPLLADEAADVAAESKDAATCQGVTGVQLKLMASTPQAPIVVEPPYLGFGPSFSHCGAPAWSSNPRGSLTPQLNAFRVGVLSNREVVVTAQAPNGITGSITIHGRAA